MKRFRRIKSEFGTKALIRTSLLLVGLLAMALIDYLAFSSVKAAVIALVGLALGFFLRRTIPKGVEYYSPIVTVGLFIYSAVLFFGDQLGLEHSTKLAIITATTVIIFGLQFWSLSDPSVVNAERSLRRG